MFSAGIVEVTPSYYKYGMSYRLVVENKTSVEGIGALVEVVAIVKDVRGEKQYQLDKSMDDLSNAVGDLATTIQQNREQKQAKHKKELAPYLKLAFNKMSKGDNEGAIEIFKEAASKKKNKYRYVAYQGMATAYRHDGHYKKAIETYQIAIKEAKKDNNFKARCYGGLGLTYLLQGEEIKANKCYIELVKHSKGYKEKEKAIGAIERILEQKGQLMGSEDIVELLKN